MTQHILKCWPAFFDATQQGTKTFELRLDDRGFQPGDTLLLCRTREDDEQQIEYDRYNEDGSPHKDAVPKNTLHLRVTYCLHGPKFGLLAGHVIMATQPITGEQT